MPHPIKLYHLPFFSQTGELALNGELNRTSARENNIGCIRSLYVHSGAVCDSVPCKLQLQHNSGLQHLTQIKEEDESKTSSRNSIHRLASKEGKVEAEEVAAKEPESSDIDASESNESDSAAEADDETAADESAAVILDHVEAEVKVISTTEDNTTHIVVKDPSPSNMSVSSSESGSSKAGSSSTGSGSSLRGSGNASTVTA